MNELYDSVSGFVEREKERLKFEEKNMNTHNDPKMERICADCGVMYSEVIAKECPLCKHIEETQDGDFLMHAYLRRTLIP